MERSARTPQMGVFARHAIGAAERVGVEDPVGSGERDVSDGTGEDKDEAKTKEDSGPAPDEDAKRVSGPSGRLYSGHTLGGYCIQIVGFPRSEASIALSILANVATMARQSPLDPPSTQKATIIDVYEWVFRGRLTTELGLWVVAVSLLGHRQTYLSDAWGRLKLEIATLAWLPILIPRLGRAIEMPMLGLAYATAHGQLAGLAAVPASAERLRLASATYCVREEKISQTLTEAADEGSQSPAASASDGPPPPAAAPPLLAKQHEPSLTATASGSVQSLHSMVDGWIKGFFHICKLMKRLDRAAADFLTDVSELETMRLFVHRIQSHLVTNEQVFDAFATPNSEYKPLRTLEIDDSLAAFLTVNAEAIERGDDEDDETMAALADGPLKVEPEPGLPTFDGVIGRYIKQVKSIQRLPSVISKSWLKIGSKPVKQALATWVTKWQSCYTSYLQELAESMLTERHEFMTNINGGLSKEVEPDDAEALLKAMTCIRDVRLRTELVNGLFDPLCGKVSLLRKCGVTLAEEYIEMQENAPYDSSNTTKATYGAREQLAPLQALQAEKIKEQADDFGIKVQDFRATFSEEAPSKYAVR